MTQPILRTLLATVLLLGVASTASAQEARELFTQGQAAYETGDYETAVSSWERAYELDPRPLLQYNLAQAYERLAPDVILLLGDRFEMHAAASAAVRRCAL